MTSPDGITWTLRESPTNSWNCVTYGRGLFVAVAFGNGVMTSTDGITWKLRTTFDNNWTSITYGEKANSGTGLFVAVADQGTGKRVMTSPDGITWKLRKSPDSNWTSVTFGSGLFVAVCKFGNNQSVMTATYLENPQSPTITNFTIPTKTNGAAQFTITAPQSNSSGSFSYTSSNSRICI
jgi:hypothetical protein